MLLCQTHYMRKFLEAGGVYEPFVVAKELSPSEAELERQVREQERRAQLVKEIMEQAESTHKKIAESKGIFQLNGATFDIDDILDCLDQTDSVKIDPQTTVGDGRASPDYADDHIMYRTLATHKDFEM